MGTTEALRFRVAIAEQDAATPAIQQTTHRFQQQILADNATQAAVSVIRVAASVLLELEHSTAVQMGTVPDQIASEQKSVAVQNLTQTLTDKILGRSAMKII